MTPERLADIKAFDYAETAKAGYGMSCIASDLEEARKDLLAEIEALTAERDKWKEALVSKQFVACSWCGKETYREGRTDEELAEEINRHVMACNKRPERKLLEAYLGIVVPLGIDISKFEKGDIDGVIAAVDRRWKEVLAMIPEAQNA